MSTTQQSVADSATSTTSSAQENVADSATSRTRKATRSPAEVDLDRRTAIIMKRVMKPRDGDSAVDRELADHLAHIEIHSLHSARRLDDGKPEFETIEAYIKHLSKVAREELRASETRCVKTGYKLINEAFVYNRLIPQITVQPPTRRAQVQVLEDCAAEKRAKIWTQTVADAKGRKITSKMVANAARAQGEDIPVPTPSNSQKHSKAAPLYQILRSAFEKGARDAGQVGEFEEFDQLMSKSSPQGEQVAPEAKSGSLLDAETESPVSAAVEQTDTAPAANSNAQSPAESNPGFTVEADKDGHPPFVISGEVDEILTAERPWVTTFAGKVFVAFPDSLKHHKWVEVGFPSLKPAYSFEGGKFGGVWEHTQFLTQHEQTAEVARVAQDLAMIAPKMQGLKQGEPRFQRPSVS